MMALGVLYGFCEKNSDRNHSQLFLQPSLGTDHNSHQCRDILSATDDLSAQKTRDFHRQNISVR